MTGTENPIRTVLFSGKGGTGKSTCSVSLACHLAMTGTQVKVLSLDRAHSIRLLTGSLTRQRVGADAAARLDNHLAFEEPDFDELARAWLATISDEINKRYRYLTTLNLESFADVIRLTPGVHEHILCRMLVRTVTDAPAGAVCVLDMPATASVHSLLHYVLSSRKWLSALRTLSRRIDSDERYTRSVEGKGKGDGSERTGRIDALSQGLGRIAELVAADATAFVSVLNPDALSLAETLDTHRVLARLDARFKLLVVNKWEDSETGRRVLQTLKGRSETPLITLPDEDFTARDVLGTYTRLGERLWKRLNNS